MCGRYALYGPHSRYREQFGTADDLAFPARYNIAPSQALPVVVAHADGTRAFMYAQWGLVPAWAKNGEGMPKPINAKAETAALKPMFRHAFRHGRVLVPADAFYEWKAGPGGKQPYLVRMRDGEPFGMAGLLERRQGAEGEEATFAILTTTPNSLMASIHDRMPAIVAPDAYAAWLDPAETDVSKLLTMLGPYPERLMEAYPVSRAVNSPANEGAELAKPIDPR